MFSVFCVVSWLALETLAVKARSPNYWTTKDFPLPLCFFLKYLYYDKVQRTSIVVQWLGLRGPSVGDPGLIPGQGTNGASPVAQR